MTSNGSRSKVRRRRRLHAVSLFSNCGAGDVGYARAGFQFDVMAELDSRRLEVALLNHPTAVGVPGDLRTTWSEVVSKYRQKLGERSPALLAACPPCQGMSSVRSGRGLEADPNAGTQDDRNLLVEVIAEVAKALRPRAIVIENVPAFLTRKVHHPRTGRPISAASLLIRRLRRNYVVFPFLADLADFGVPQTRKRAFLTFVKRNDPGLERLEELNRAPYPRPTQSSKRGRGRISITEALAELGARSLDASCQSDAADPEDGFHSVPVWEDRRYDMVAAIPADSGRSAWENDRCSHCGKVPVESEDVLCPSCGGPLLRPIVKARNGRYRLIHGFRSTSYRRLPPDRPCATITTASGHIGSSFTIHPFENRLLSPRECSHLQTFPSNFRWGDALKKWGQTNVRAMIGEAVPPRFTKLHGQVLAGILTGRWTRAAIAATDSRCVATLEKLRANS